jgi:hypothetical protein
MDESTRKYLESRFAFEDWRGAFEPHGVRCIWNFLLLGDELPGWRLHRSQSAAGGDGLRGVRSVWTKGENHTESLLTLDVFECASRLEAHALLLERLGEFQSPQIERQYQGAGEVAFGPPGEASLLFARANLVALVLNGGAKVVPVGGLARQFDEDLSSRPDVSKGPVLPTIHRFELLVGEVRREREIPLDVNASDPMGRPLTLKFFSDTGDVLLREGRPAYVARASGAQRVTVFAVNGLRGSVSQTLEFEAR